MTNEKTQSYDKEHGINMAGHTHIYYAIPTWHVEGGKRPKLGFVIMALSMGYFFVAIPIAAVLRMF